MDGQNSRVSIYIQVINKTIILSKTITVIHYFHDKNKHNFAAITIKRHNITTYNEHHCSI